MAEEFGGFEEFRRDVEREIARMLRDIEEAISAVTRGAVRTARRAMEVIGVGIPIDLYETAEKYILVAELPGVPKEKLSVNATEDGVEIIAEFAEPIKEGGLLLSERRRGKVRRVVRLPEPIAPDKAKAKLENGLLILELPKAKVTKKVNIKVE